MRAGSAALSLMVALTACTAPMPAPEGDADAGPLLAFDDVCEARNGFICRLQQACGLAALDAPCDDIIGGTDWARGDCHAGAREALDAGFRRYDPHAGYRCLIETTPDCTFNTTCSIFVAQQPVGAGCFDTIDCIEGVCDLTQTCPGVCRPLPDAGAMVASPSMCGPFLGVVAQKAGGFRCAVKVGHGEACTGPDDAWASNACIDVVEQCVTDADGGPGRCEAPIRSMPPAIPARGEPCSRSRACLAGLACHDDGKCGSLLGHGQSCELAPSGCDTDLRCDDGSARCTWLDGSGGPCEQDTDCLRSLECGDDSRCHTAIAPHEADGCP